MVLDESACPSAGSAATATGWAAVGIGAMMGMTTRLSNVLVTKPPNMTWAIGL